MKREDAGPSMLKEETEQQNAGPGGEPLLRSGGGEWLDVTKDLGAWCASLGLGGMVLREGFTLFDSMNALELMSTKMDSAMNLQGTKPAHERIAEGLVPLPLKRDSHLCWVLRELMIKELAWYENCLLATSVHSCVLVCKEALSELKTNCSTLLASTLVAKNEISKFNLEEGVSENEVASFVSYVLLLSVVKSCGQVYSLLRYADLFDEEDFSFQVSGLPLAKETSPEELDTLLQCVQVVLDKVSDLNSGFFSSQGVKELAMHAKFRSKYVSGLALMMKENLTGFREAELLWIDLLQLFEGSFGPEFSENDSFPEEEASLLFDLDLHKAILAGTPPRAVPIYERGEAQKAWKQIFQGMLEVCSMRSIKTLLGLYFALLDFSRKAHNILVRSSCVNVLYSGNRKAVARYPLDKWILKDLEQHGMALPYRTSEICGEFCNQLMESMYYALRILLQNPARQRRNIANVLPEWGRIEQMARVIDLKIHAQIVPDREPSLTNSRLFITQWAICWTTRLMMHHLILGFQLELYNPCELEIIFDQGVRIAKAFLEAREHGQLYSLDLAQELHGEASKLKWKTAADLQQQKRVLETHAAEIQVHVHNTQTSELYLQEVVLMESQKKYCEGMLSILELRLHGRFQLPRFEFSSDEIRYNARLLPYAMIVNPPYIRFRDFEFIRHRDSKGKKIESLQEATDAFGFAKELISKALKERSMSNAQKEYLRGLLKVLVSNSVVALREKSENAKPAKLQVLFPAAQEMCFLPVIAFE